MAAALLLLAGGVEGVGRDHGAAASVGPGCGAGQDLLREVAQVGAVRGVDVRLLTVEGKSNKKVNKMRWNKINGLNNWSRLRVLSKGHDSRSLQQYFETRQ